MLTSPLSRTQSKALFHKLGKNISESILKFSLKDFNSVISNKHFGYFLGSSFPLSQTISEIVAF